ncbi:DUF1697 domain-containing protein [Hydrogenophaga sp. NH-16]|uniref:DUF1697 domain-containing protein n=1 Tax=Hydrogenophaga sp. NH-16 TaxID=2184519 RepID=UPI0013E400BA|nr:DUF1697 domain-containing protein [Hydrogenophaga sp. NH-16]
MSRFAVLLRGVNVGKANRVPMAEFRAMLEALGHSDVKTLLNSGNAVFTSIRRGTDKLADEIGAGLRERFGVTTPVVVKSASELQAIVDGNPIVPPEAEHGRFLVAFAMAPDRLTALESLRPLLLPGERLAVTAHAAYLHCANGLLESRAGEALLGKVGKGVTSRNWGTVIKLAALV